MSSTEAEPVNRYTLLEQIREESGKSERTEIIIDYIQELWETIDLLKQRFGEKRTQEIIEAFSPFSCLPDDF